MIRSANILNPSAQQRCRSEAAAAVRPRDSAVSEPVTPPRSPIAEETATPRIHLRRGIFVHRDVREVRACRGSLWRTGASPWTSASAIPKAGRSSRTECSGRRLLLCPLSGHPFPSVGESARPNTFPTPRARFRARRCPMT